MSADRWVLVPVEPTVGMCIAGDSARANVDDLTRTPAIYRAMLAAAPAAPAAEPVGCGHEACDCRSYCKRKATEAAPAQSREPLTLTDEQIEDMLPFGESMPDGCDRWGHEVTDTFYRRSDMLAIARAAVSKFCRINGIGSQP